MQPLGTSYSLTPTLRRSLITLAVLIALVGMSGCPKATAPVPPPPTTPPVVVPPVEPPPSADWTLNWAWQQRVDNAPFCTAALTTSCIKSFSWGYTVGSAQTIVKTTALPYPACPATIPSPATLSCQTPADATGTVTIFDTAHSLLPLGGAGFVPFVQTNWVDMNGAAQVTAPGVAPAQTKNAPSIVTGSLVAVATEN